MAGIIAVHIQVWFIKCQHGRKVFNGTALSETAHQRTPNSVWVMYVGAHAPSFPAASFLSAYTPGHLLSDLPRAWRFMWSGLFSFPCVEFLTPGSLSDCGRCQVLDCGLGCERSPCLFRPKPHATPSCGAMLCSLQRRGAGFILHSWGHQSSVLDLSDRRLGGIVNTLSDRMRLPKVLTGSNNEPDS